MILLIASYDQETALAVPLIERFLVRPSSSYSMVMSLLAIAELVIFCKLPPPKMGVPSVPIMSETKLGE